MKTLSKALFTCAAPLIAMMAQANASSTEEIEQKARDIVGDKYVIEDILVVADWTGNTNRIDSYSARVTPKGCSGALDLYFDDAGFLQSSHDTIKC